MSDGRKRILSPFTGRKKRKAWDNTREKYMPETDCRSYFNEEERVEEFLDDKGHFYNGSESDDSDNDDENCNDTHQGPSGTKVPRLDMYRSIISLSKTAHQMWRDRTFNQRNKTAERVVGVDVGDNRVGRGDWTKFQKGRGVGNIGGRVFIK